MTAAELTQWREAHGMTKTALAAKLGVSVHTVLRWEKRHRRIPGPVPLALAHLHHLARDAEKKRRRRAVERVRRESLRLPLPFEEKFW